MFCSVRIGLWKPASTACSVTLVSWWPYNQKLIKLALKQLVLVFLFWRGSHYSLWHPDHFKAPPTNTTGSHSKTNNTFPCVWSSIQHEALIFTALEWLPGFFIANNRKKIRLCTDANAEMLTQPNNVCFLKTFIEYFVYLEIVAQIFVWSHLIIQYSVWKCINTLKTVHFSQQLTAET